MQKNCCLQGKEVLGCSEGFLRSEFLIACLFLWKIQVWCVNHSSHWLWAEITVVTLVIPQNPEPIIFRYFITNALASLGIHCGQTIERLSIQSLSGCSIHVIVDVLQNWAIDRTFTPEITDEERNKKVRMWKKAVTYSFNWAKED